MERADRTPGRSLSAEAFLLACLVRLAVRATTLERLLNLLGRLPRSQSADTAAACLAAAQTAAGRAAHETCLFASLVGYGLLARRGYDVSFNLGVSRAPAFHAHAWLSMAGGRVETEEPGPFAVIWRRQPPRRTR